MKASLRALLTNLLDYAGLFPPAQLPLDVSLSNYVGYRAADDCWMLGRFLCPAARLAEITETGLRGDDPLTISALGQGASLPADAFSAAVSHDVKQIESFRRQWGNRVGVDCYETRLPAGFTAGMVAKAASLLKSAELMPFFEPTLDATLEATLDTLLPMVDGGIKLRCGGVVAAAFPTTERLAMALSTCVTYRRPFKATAGLHHPFRHFDQVLQVKAHGFLNLFCAGVLAATHQLNASQIESILAEEDGGRFHFEEDKLRFDTWQASIEDIVRGRRDFAVSFGSCSFDEPREDLRMLGLMK